MSEPTTEAKAPIQYIAEADGIYRNSRTEVLYERPKIDGGGIQPAAWPKATYIAAPPPPSPTRVVADQ